ncbi:MAG: hypothetical protein ACREDR_13900, partial [Blastocatellia bacterium]
PSVLGLARTDGGPMLIIELRRPKVGVCPDCENSGVMLPGKRKLLTELGVFCSCPIGVEKWEATKERIALIESDLAALPPLPPLGPRSTSIGHDARHQKEPSRSFRIS